MASDITRARVVAKLLHPLIEGMAVFAEFDVGLSQRSPVVPPPMQWAALLVSQDGLTGTSDSRLTRRMRAARMTSLALWTARRGKRSRQAKETLLSEPLDASVGEPYLMGYLFVKSLYRFWAQHHERYLEPEVFLLRLYDLFFEDELLVSMLLDESSGLPHSLIHLDQHIEQRIEFSFNGARETLGGFFDHLAEKRTAHNDASTDQGSFFPTFHPLDEVPAGRFRTLWARTNEPQFEGPATPDYSVRATRAAASFYAVGIGRDLLELGHFEAYLDVRDDIVSVAVGDAEAIRLPKSQTCPESSSSGQVHILLNTATGEHIVAAATHDSNIAGFKTTALIHATHPISVSKLVFGRLAGPTSGHGAVVDSSEANSLQELRRINGYVSQATARLNEMYGPSATFHVPLEKLTQVAPTLMQHGIYGLFDFDRNLIRTLAFIGASTKFYGYSSNVAEELQEIGIDYNSALSRLKNYAAETNLFVINDDLGIYNTL